MNNLTNNKLKDKLEQLKAAIRQHRDAKGHDRCWENDLTLYKALGEDLPSSPELPPEDQFLGCCREYYRGQAAGSVNPPLFLTVAVAFDGNYWVARCEQLSALGADKNKTVAVERCLRSMHSTLSILPQINSDIDTVIADGGKIFDKRKT